MPLHAQKKGKAGEVEFCKWIFENSGIEVERVYNQASGSSADIVTDDFIFEIKRREVIALDTWWHQVAIAKKNHKDKDLIPVVAYRKNRQPWSFLIPANLVPGLNLGYLAVNERVFKEFFAYIVARSPLEPSQGLPPSRIPTDSPEGAARVAAGPVEALLVGLEELG